VTETRNCWVEPVVSVCPGGSDTETVTVYRCPSATGRGASSGDVDDPDDTATTAELRPPWAPAGGAATPGASAGTTLTDTRTPSSGTLPQLVTVAETPRVPVGGTTAGAAAGTADVGVAHEVDIDPIPPLGTAGGVIPTAVSTNRWKATRAGAEASALADAARRVLPSGAVASGAGTQTGGCLDRGDLRGRDGGRAGRRCPGDRQRLHPEESVDGRPERRRRGRPKDHDLREP